MKKKFIAYVLAVAFIVGVMPMPQAGAAAKEENVAYTKQETLQPLGTQFDIHGILNWTPESDPDARYNVSNVPLAERETGYVVNPYANPDAKMVLSSDAYPIGGTATYSYGTEGAWRRYAVNFWQYVDVYNFWGGPINVPTPELVDSAHRNGVPVVGTVFFENAAVSGFQRMVYFNQGTKTEPYYPYADKLWEIADFYGFDGWFFNFEATGTTTASSHVHAEEIAAFLTYMQDTKPREDMILTLYDSPTTTDNSGSFQSRLSEGNKYKLEYNGETTANYFFGDYKWRNRTYATNTQTTALNNDIDPYRFTFSWPIHMNGYLTIGNASGNDTTNGLMYQANWIRHDASTAALAGDPSLENKAMASVGLFGGHSPINLANNVGDFLNLQDPRLWSGYRGLAVGDGQPADPSDGYLGLGNYNASTNPDAVIDGVQVNNAVKNSAEAWYGFSQILADKTVILDFPFVTSFNAGIGHKFFVDGEQVKGDWTNRGIQDILPTWRWTVRKNGAPSTEVSPSFDTDDAWYGGTSLKLQGNASSANEVRLYSTFLDFASNEDYELTYIAKGSPVKFGFYTAADYSRYIIPSAEAVAESAENGWTSYTQSLSELKGKMIYGIAIITDTGAVNANIGQIMVDTADKSATLSAPANLTLDGFMVRDRDNGEARIYWDAVSGDADRYEIYQIYADGSRKFLNATYANAFFLSNIKRDLDSSMITLEVTAVDKSLQRGDAATISFDFGLGEDDASVVSVPYNPNLVLDTDGTRLQILTSREGSSEPGKAIFDGDRVQSKWCFDGTNGIAPNGAATIASDNGQFVVFDTGEPITVSRWLTVHAGGIESVDFNTKTYRLSYIPIDEELHFEWRTGTLSASDSAYFNLVRGSSGTTITNTNGYSEGNWVIADRVVDNPTTEAGNIVDRDFPDGPVTARYWMLLVEESMWAVSNQALRLFSLEMYEHPKEGEYMPPSDAINMNQVKVVRGESSDSVYFQNLPTTMPGAKVGIYNSIDDATPIATASRQSDGTARIDGLTLDANGGRLYYDVTYTGYGPSNRNSIPYYAKESAISGIPVNVSLNMARFGRDYASEVAHVIPAVGVAPNAEGGVKLWADASSVPSNSSATRSQYIVNKDIFYGAIDATLPEGAKLYIYASETSSFPYKASAPVADGATSTRVDAITFANAGGYIWASAKEQDKPESSRFKIYYTSEREIYRDSIVELQALYESALRDYPAEHAGYYAPATWTLLQNAMTAAKAILDNPDDVPDLEAAIATAIENLQAAILAIEESGVLPSHGIVVSIDKKLVQNGDYFNAATEFGISDVSTNAAIVTYEYDSSLFEYRGVTPAAGISILGNPVVENGSVKFTLANLNGYNTGELLSVMFSATVTGLDLKRAENSVSVNVEYVYQDGNGAKSLLNAASSSTFLTTGPDPDPEDPTIPGKYTLIDLSNTIDLFNVTVDDPEWVEARFYDFNGNGVIDISDISYIASKI